MKKLKKIKLTNIKNSELENEQLNELPRSRADEVSE